ncbi:MAG: hypothetical protein LBK06_09630 [Planctomycetaceae bacterium]|jgi:hypothetical protein|nr:hypothetical protein [Planctomycetaceae bacterium]
MISIFRTFFVICLAVLALSEILTAQEQKLMGQFHKVPLAAEESIKKYADKARELFSDDLESYINSAEDYAHKNIPGILEGIMNIYDNKLGSSGNDTLFEKWLLRETVENCYQKIRGQSGQSILNWLDSLGMNPIEECYQEFQKESWFKRKFVENGFQKEEVKEQIKQRVANEMQKRQNDLKNYLKNEGQEPWHTHFFTENMCGYNIGFYPSGIRRDQDPTGIPIGEDHYYVDIMRKADNIAVSSGKWLPEKSGKPYGYNLFEHNCHHFTKNLRNEYDKIITKMKEAISQLELLQSQPLRPQQENLSLEEKIVIARNPSKIAQSGQATAKEMDNIDVANCPDDFVNAFNAYRDACKKKIQLFGKTDAMTYVTIGIREKEQFQKVCRAYKLN